MKIGNEIISIKQLPIIYQMLDQLSDEIDSEIEKSINSIPESPELAYSYSKKERARLRKIFSNIDERRKYVKSEIMKKYIEFEDIYKVKISSKLEKADEILKSRILAHENRIKQEIQNKLKKYFVEYCISHSIPYITFEDMNLKINTSESLKNYISRINQFIDTVKNDLETIESIDDEYKRKSILIEYKSNGCKLSKAMNYVEQKFLQMKKLEEYSQMVEPSETLVKRTIENENNVKKYKLTFSVTGSIQELKKLKNYMQENKLIFE